RVDKVFVQRLHEGLLQQQKNVWVDWEDIPQAADWRAEIHEGIEEAEAVVFVMSPDFLNSMECMMELEMAEEFNKRLIPIVYREPEVEEVPPSLASLNWIFFRETDDFEGAVEQLIGAMETDLDWVKRHTRLTRRALEWEKRERNESYLLRGDDLAEAVQSLSQPNREPVLTHLQQEYIAISQQSQAAEFTRQLKQARQLRQRLWIAVGLLGAVVLVGLFSIILAIEHGTLLLGAEEIVDSIVAFADGQANSDICWGGSLKDLVEEVMPACDRAIELDPENPFAHESRGLAQALLGNTPAAIEDFNNAITIALETNTGEYRVPRWEEWVQQLEQGDNP
ncbi:MAG: TIR domain-containing protein, partial [Deltaproteobacteria bacterium]|nr:TIR domain-containing protein [Deltaproteobacteria bacterium]